MSIPQPFFSKGPGYFKWRCKAEDCEEQINDKTNDKYCDKHFTPCLTCDNLTHYDQCSECNPEVSQ